MEAQHSQTNHNQPPRADGCITCRHFYFIRDSCRSVYMDWFSNMRRKPGKNICCWWRHVRCSRCIFDPYTRIFFLIRGREPFMTFIVEELIFSPFCRQLTYSLMLNCVISKVWGIYSMSNMNVVDFFFIRQRNFKGKNIIKNEHTVPVTALTSVLTWY